jgi:hypothetical protein
MSLPETGGFFVAKREKRKKEVKGHTSFILFILFPLVAFCG